MLSGVSRLIEGRLSGPFYRVLSELCHQPDVSDRPAGFEIGRAVERVGDIDSQLEAAGEFQLSPKARANDVLLVPDAERQRLDVADIHAGTEGEADVRGLPRLPFQRVP